MDEQAFSMSRQLLAEQMDIPVTSFRDERHLTGAFEAWLTQEGIEPSNPDSFSVNENELRFAFREGLWTAHLARSINFPDAWSVEIGLDLVAVPRSASETVAVLLGTNNPHFTLKIAELDEQDLVVSAVSHCSAEPKNMQLAIGVVINDISSFRGELMEMLLAIPGAESLMNY